MLNRTIEWLSDQYADAVQAFLDDPWGVVADTCTIKEHDDMLRLVGEDLGFNYDITKAEQGTEYELERMETLLAS